MTGIAREPDPGSGEGSPPVIQVTAFDPLVTEGDRVVVQGTYADPRGLAVTMAASTGGIINQGGQAWATGPTGTWQWNADIGDGPGVLDVTLTASNADATSPPTQLHFVIANAIPTGSVEGPGLVPASGVHRTYRTWVTDAGRDLVAITPTCGTGAVVSYTGGQVLVCAFSAETSTQGRADSDRQGWGADRSPHPGRGHRAGPHARRCRPVDRRGRIRLDWRGCRPVQPRRPVPPGDRHPTSSNHRPEHRRGVPRHARTGDVGRRSRHAAARASRSRVRLTRWTSARSWARPVT